MAKKQTHSSAKRFGARYGRKLRAKFAAIDAEQKKKHVCPYCQAERVKREARGIWHCTKCKSTFTGRCYVPASSLKLTSTTKGSEKTIDFSVLERKKEEEDEELVEEEAQ